MRQLVYTFFITNIRASFHLWWKENLVKHQNVPQYYCNDCSYFLVKFVLQQQFYIVPHGAAINFLFWISSLFFFFKLLINSISLGFDSWISCFLRYDESTTLSVWLLSEFLVVDSGGFLCFLDTVNAGYRASFIANNNFRNNFYGNIFWSVKEMSQILVTHFLDNKS